MGEPYTYPVHALWASARCPKCHGKGTTTGEPLEECWDYCDCIYDQLVSKVDFIRLADGDITVHPSEDL